MSATSTEFNRDAVITIQGGGIFGLFLIGQLEYVLQELQIKPLAYAGTSAGAILATLSWAGYSPRQIRDLLIKRASVKDGIISLLGPFDSSSSSAAFHFSDLAPLMKRMKQLVDEIPSFITALEPLKEWERKWFWQKAAILRSLSSKVKLDRLMQAFRDGETALSLANAVGCFSGNSLEDQMEEWLRESPLFKDYSLPEGRTRHTFRDARKASISPPLFLAATNLSTRSLELISSIKGENDDYDYDDVSIASAVRASAAVPGFFRPVNLRFNSNKLSLVDGGWISNYPMWVFSRDLRARLLKMPAYQVLGSKLWVHIGLRLFPKSKRAGQPINTLREFGGAAFELSTGGARSEMDDRAAPQEARLRPVWQKADDASAIDDFLDLTAFNANLVTRCFSNGREAAQDWLGNMSFALPDDQQIEDILDEIVAFAGQIFRSVRPSVEIHARSNIFLPRGNEFRMAYRANMDGELDTDRDLWFSDTRSGLSGFAFTRRKSMVCNLEKIGQLYKSGEISANDLFGMDKRLGGMVREDRTWLASVPIFDPSAIVSERWDEGQVSYDGAYYQDLRPSIDGPVFGVLNVDAAIPYRQAQLAEDVKTRDHWTDVRVVSIIAKMERSAIKLGQCFSACFAKIAAGQKSSGV